MSSLGSVAQSSHCFNLVSTKFGHVHFHLRSATACVTHHQTVLKTFHFRPNFQHWQMQVICIATTAPP